MSNVDKPSHYQGTYGVECIEAIRNALTPEEFRGYCKGCAMKYLWREQGKGKTEDLNKARMYLDFLTLGRLEESRNCFYCEYHSLKGHSADDWCEYFYCYIDVNDQDNCEGFERKDDGE